VTVAIRGPGPRWPQRGWFLWEDLDRPTRHMLAAMIEYEADRFIRPGYTVPYWNGKGGDTKAEENAWNAMLLHTGRGHDAATSARAAVEADCQRVDGVGVRSRRGHEVEHDRPRMAGR